MVNGSRNALASGATSARILREWYEQGVEVYSHPTLHAKVFVIGRTAIVGSANLSQRASIDNTAEAAIQTTDRAIVGQARDFVKRMEDDATNVDETWLKMAEKVPVAKSRCPLGPRFTLRTGRTLRHLGRAMGRHRLHRGRNEVG